MHAERPARLPAYARLAIAASLAFYATAGMLYVVRLPLIMDEFQGAAAVQRLFEELPYRDFTPYKTVLGYYLQLPALALVRGPWAGLIAVKLEMLALSFAGLSLLAIVLRRFFSATAMALSFPMLVVMTTFLERSAELRVDMPTGWAGAASLLGLMAGLPFAAGLLSSLSFLISQKGIYFCVAGAIALLVAASNSPSGVPRFRSLARYLLGLGLGLAGYVSAWAAISSPARVWEATFARPIEVAMGTLPMARGLYWLQTVILNPVFWAAVLVGVAVLLFRPARVSSERASAILLGSYALAVLLMGLWHKQPWPYFIAMLVPVLFLPVLAAVDVAVGALRGAGSRTRGIAMALWLVGGIVIPLGGMRMTLTRNNAMQRRTIVLAHDLLGPGDPYLAGLSLLRDRPHQPGSLSWLDRSRLRALLASSLAVQRAYADSLRRSPVKVVVDNGRVRSLPCPILEVLEAQYWWVDSNVWLYAPPLPVADSVVTIAYAGVFEISGVGEAGVTIDSRTLRDGNRINLRSGAYRVLHNSGGRLRLLPPAEVMRSQSAPPTQLFPKPYNYVLPVAAESGTDQMTFAGRCAKGAAH